MFDLLDILLALYCASIIIGAGLLSLPLAAAWLGLAPLVGAIILIGLHMMYVNRLLTESLYAYLQRVVRRKAALLDKVARATRGGLEGNSAFNEAEAIRREVDERGSRQMAELAHGSGLGPAAWSSIILGMAIYVICADVGYVTYGKNSLNSIAEFIGHVAPHLFPTMILGGAGLMLGAWNFERLVPHPFLGRGTLMKVGAMLGAWLVGIGVLGIMRGTGLLGAQGLTGLVGTLLGLALFTGAVLAGLYTRETKAKSYSTARSAVVVDQHMVNILVASAEIVLLGITIIIVLWIAFWHGQLVVEFTFAPHALIFTVSTLGAWAKMIGLIIFAYVGTGLFNLCSYPSIFETTSGKRSPRVTRVVVLGTLIPMLVYLVWTLTSTSVLTGPELAALDAQQKYTTIGIAEKFSVVDPAGTSWISLFGYLVALLAVTSACNGFTESLSDQFSVALEDLRAMEGRWATLWDWLAQRLNGSPDNVSMRLAVLLVAVCLALITSQVKAINVSSLLSVAGNAGGGILILMLPFFLPPPGQPKSTWWKAWFGANTGFVLTMLVILAIDFASLRSAASWAVAVITVLIALSISVMAVWLLRSEPKPNVDEPQSFFERLAIGQASRRVSELVEKEEE